MYTIIEIMGPAISGFILLFTSLHYGFLITGTAYLLALCAISFLEKKEASAPSAKESFWKEFAAGWRELLRNRPLWQITVLVIFLNATSGMFDAMIVYFAKDQQRLDNSQLGMVLSVIGAGGLVGSALVVYLRKRFPTGRLLATTILLLGVSYSLMVLAQNIWLMCLALFLTGMIGTIENICIWTFRQETTPLSMMGRITDFTGSIFKLGMVFSIYLSGWVTEWMGPGIVFTAAAIGNLLIFLVYRQLSLWRLA